MESVNATYPGYLGAFRKFEALWSVEDQQRFSFLTEHEVAANTFLDLEASGTNDSAVPFKAYLNTSPDTWFAMAE